MGPGVLARLAPLAFFAPADFSRRPTTRPQAPMPNRSGGRHAEDPVQVRIAPSLKQKGDFHRRQGRLFPVFFHLPHPSPYLLTYPGVQKLVEGFSFGRMGEDKPAQLTAVHPPPGVQNTRSKALLDFPGEGPVREKPVAHLVGLKHGEPLGLEQGQHLAFPGANAARQAHHPGAFPALWLTRAQSPVCSRKAWNVFLSSKAMVMGPTPPGTGLMAEATWDTGP